LFDLSALVADIHETYWIIATEAGYELTLSDHTAGHWVGGDPNLVRQLLANLIENSMRHTPVGSHIALELFAKREWIWLSVSDNGHGIPVEERERVFDRFYRLEKSRTTSGSGLGLSLVRAIAELHGATIRLLDNRPGLQVVIEFPKAAL